MSDELDFEAKPEVVSNKVGPHPGIGLFPSDNAKAGARRALAIVNRLSTKQFAEEEEEQILLIARHYDADKKHEDEMTLSGVKVECSEIIKHINKALSTIDGLSLETIAFIHGGHSRTRFTQEDMKLLQHGLSRLRGAAARSIPEQRKIKSKALPNAFKRVIALRETIEGRTFSNNWNERPEIKGPPSTFIAEDANFVLQVLNAIDSEVRFSHVRSIGKSWSKRGKADRGSKKI